jgi:hypothetical protein
MRVVLGCLLYLFFRIGWNGLSAPRDDAVGGGQP